MGNGLTLFLLAFIWMPVESRTHLKETKGRYVIDHPATCYDLIGGCERRVNNGRCSENANLEKLCPKSCGACDASCFDTKLYCFRLKQLGYCNRYDYRNHYCRKTCGGCETGRCYDSISECKHLSDRGHCRYYTTWMDLCQKTCGKCGGDFVGGQYLTFHTNKLPWEVAKADCSRYNSRLAIIKDPNAFHTYVSDKFAGESFWLGGEDTTGSWSWHNGQQLGDFPWGPGQPDNWNNNEHCMEWGWQNNYNDDNCNNVKRYVCERL